MTNNEVVNAVLLFTIHYVQLKTASILHVNYQSSVEMFPASLRLRQKTQILQQNVKIYSLVFSILACAWQLQKKSYGRLSGNNRPITDYLKNGRLIGFADYLPINRLIPTVELQHMQLSMIIISPQLHVRRVLPV
jgi:hypothetical protein